jgi:ribonuclease R
MIGQATGERFGLGDAVTVKLVEAAPVAGALRFSLLSDGKVDKVATSNRPRRSPYKGRPKTGRKR